MTVDLGAAVNEHYMCVDTKEVNVREGFDLDSPIVRKLRHGDVVRGVLKRHNSKQHLRLQLPDGTWTSIHAGSSSDPFLRAIEHVDAPYVCVHEGVNVRRGFNLDSPIVRALKYGDVVRGRLTCTNHNRILRLQLEDGTWTSVHGGTPSEPLLRAASSADEHFVCVEKQEVNVRQGFQLDTPIIRTIRHGDVVRGSLACMNGDGILRLQLEDGAWTSVHGRDGAFLVSISQLLQERAGHLEQLLCQVCMDKTKCVAFNCGHQSCEACSHNLKSCPECRTAITTRIRLYP